MGPLKKDSSSKQRDNATASTHSSNTRLATCFYSWQTMRAYFLDMVWPFSHCSRHTHTDTLVTWLWRCFCARQAYIVCRARGGLWCNQYQISAVSLWALIPSGSLDWLLAAYAIPLLSPTSPVFPLPFFFWYLLSLSAHYSPLSIRLHPPHTTPHLLTLPFFHPGSHFCSLVFFFHLFLHLHHVVIIPVIALPLTMFFLHSLLV